MKPQLLIGLALLCLAAHLRSTAAVTNIAGIGIRGFSGDGGPASQAHLNEPFGLVRGPDGALWLADYGAHLVRRIASDGTITTVAGNGTPGYAGDGEVARNASLNRPHELRFDREGNLFIADTSNHVIRKIDVKTRTITTYAGIGKPGYSGDGGKATQAFLNFPISLQFSPAGDLFIVDIGNHVIRRVDAKSGMIRTFAGTGKPGPTPDGAPIMGTPLMGPRSLDFDARGNLWLVTREGNQVFRLNIPQGVIQHVAGTGRKGFAGNGGPAKDATLSGPKGIAVAPNGDIYLADTENHAIRKIDGKRGIIEVVAGTGENGDALESEPRRTMLARPHGVFVDTGGTVLIGDSENHRILSISPAAADTP